MNFGLNGFPQAPSLSASLLSSALDPTLVGTRGGAIAGEAVKKNDGLVIAQDGKVYPFEFLDYDANASTSIPNQSYATFNHHRQQQARKASNGDLYYSNNQNSTGGLAVYRATSLGGNNISASIDTTTTARAGDRLVLLSNGAVALVWQLAGGDIKFAIYDPDLVQVVAPTVIATPASDGFFDALALSGGGFAVSWLAAAGAQKLAVYNNAGAVVSAPATIQTWTGTADTSLGVKMVELSSGDIAIAFTSRFATTKGLYVGIWSAAGAQVLAATLLYAPGTQPVVFPELAVLPGYFAVATVDAVNTKAFVLDNAGAVQGGAYTNTVGTGAAELTIKLVAAETEFWLCCQPSTTQFMFTNLPITGAGYVETKVGVDSMTAVAAIDGFYKRGYFMCSQYRYGVVFDVANRKVISAASSSAGVTVSASHSIAAGAGFKSTWLHDEPAQILLRLNNWLSFGIIGVASADTARGGQTPFTMGPGLLPINPIPARRSSPSTNFDFLSSGGGVKGSVTQGSIFIRSIV